MTATDDRPAPPPAAHPEKPTEDVAEAEEAPDRSWSGRVRALWLNHLPPERLLPDEQPSYVASWIYVFGMGAIGSLIVLVASGLVLALNGPYWYHLSAIGHFTNSVHLWSVELFFLFMVVHLWGKFWMAAWRGGRVLTWITGVASFAVSLVAAFTGYLVQTNFDSQWIAFEAKDALNATGIGAWFNPANLGQMLMWHITLLPIAVGAIVALHVILVRIHGVVPPLDAAETDAQLRTDAARPTGGQ